jgi:hypothetical protein
LSQGYIESTAAWYGGQDLSGASFSAIQPSTGPAARYITAAATIHQVQILPGQVEDAVVAECIDDREYGAITPNFSPRRHARPVSAGRMTL